MLCCRTGIWAVALTFIAGCGSPQEGGKPPADSMPAPIEVPVPGVTSGPHFYPEFQRWQIVDVRPTGRKLAPSDITSILAMLGGRFIYFSRNYTAVPFLNGGDLLTPACFTATPGSLEVLPFVPKDLNRPPARGLQFELVADGRLAFDQDSLRITLERRPLQDDGGYQQRRLDQLFNRQYLAEKRRGAKAACVMRQAKLPYRPARDLLLYAPEIGSEVTLAGADLDPELPLAMGRSRPQRQALDPSSPASVVAGCRGEWRTLWGMQDADVVSSSRGEPSRGYLIVGGVVGKMHDGEVCDRITLLRRLEPQVLLNMFSIPADQRTGMPRPATMDMLDWVDDGAFRARVGSAEFELSGIDGPRIMVTLVAGPVPETSARRRPDLPVLPPLPPPAAAPSTDSRDIVRWVDQDGVVHFSDRPGAP